MTFTYPVFAIDAGAIADAFLRPVDITILGSFEKTFLNL
jgi:hypothetical protein